MVRVRISYSSSVCAADIANQNLGSVSCGLAPSPSLERAVDYVVRKRRSYCTKEKFSGSEKLNVLYSNLAAF